MPKTEISNNPQKKGPIPPFNTEQIAPPGLEAEMDPVPDRGESTYVGHGRLTDKVALIRRAGARSRSPVTSSTKRTAARSSSARCASSGGWICS